jgi:hypothetical protein
MPSLPAAKLAHLATVIYPEDYSGAQPYTTPTQRASLAVGEALIDCFAFGVGLGYGNRTGGYMFSVFPGMHAQDMDYTFWNGASANGLGVPVDEAQAVEMQRWFVDFVKGGLGAVAGRVPVYGEGAQVVDVVDVEKGRFEVVRDPAANERCRYWLSL